MNTRNKQSFRKRIVAAAVVVLLVASGSYLALSSKAATASVSNQPETGTITAPAAIINDTTAAGAKAVQFQPATVAINPKKGVGGSKYTRPGSEDMSKISALNVAWTYNWSAVNVPTEKTNIEYVPMIWGANSAPDSVIANLTKGKAEGRFKHLLGFNEPDHSGQSNLTPDQALALWPKLMSTGLRLGSPAVTAPNSVKNTSTPGVPWLEDFMTKAEAKGYRVDFIALHYYQDWTNPKATISLQNSLTAVYEKYKKPIWITEIGTIDIQNAWGGQMKAPATFEGTLPYMQAAVPLLNSLPFVERYAWFSDNKWDVTNPTNPRNYTSLYGADNTLTPLGKVYQGLN